VLLLDLDHFKLVNDTLGHTVGDTYLQLAAERIAASLPTGGLVARHGGDSFVIVLRDVTSAPEASDIAQEMIDAFRVALTVDGWDIASTVSIGVALSAGPGQGSDAHDLIREADTAMFVAKSAGRDRIAVFDDALQEATQQRFVIANDLRRAYEQGELEVWYQPEVEFRTGDVQAVEALLRWRHPSGELYDAGRFIDIAAETGLIVDIGNDTLQQICRCAARWQERSMIVRINLAPRQLAELTLLDQFDRAIADTGVRPESMCVEITETALLQDSIVVADNLRGLSERGFEIAIDDFGTGYASLTYLRLYPIDVIKIDRSFITDIATSARDRDLTAAVVAMANQLGISVTAEGIEGPEQAEVLRSVGCPSGQGYLYSPAVPAAAIDDLITTTGHLAPGRRAATPSLSAR
jgi:diguanylate cyclase (GGDEF)-like protein